MAAKINYTRLRSRADAMLARFGAPAILLRAPPSDAGTGQPWDPPSQQTGAPAEHPCTAVATQYSQAAVDGTNILASDRLLYVAAGSLDVDPQVSDLIRLGGTTYNVVNVQPLQPGPTVLLWQVQGRA